MRRHRRFNRQPKYRFRSKPPQNGLHRIETLETRQLLAVLPFEDGFNRPDNTNLGDAWVETAGNIQIIGQQLVLADNAQAVAVLGDLAAENVSLSIDVGLGPDEQERSVGLLARQSGPSDSTAYFARLYRSDSGFAAQIWRATDGNYFPLRSVFVDGGQGTLRFDVVGPSLQLFFNDELVASAVDYAISGPGSVGIRQTGGRADNFSAEARVPTLVTQMVLPFADTFDQPDGAKLTPTWAERQGDARISAGSVRLVAHQTTIATVNGPFEADVTVEADIDLSDSGQNSNIGLLARYAGTTDGNAYLGRLMPGSNGGYFAQIWRHTGGDWQFLAHNQVNGPSGRLRFEVEDDRLQLFFNGQLAVDVVDTSIPGPGLIGIRHSLGQLDNFSADITQSFILTEQSNLVSEARVPFEIPDGTGSKIVSFEVSAFFDTTDSSAAAEDRFLVYLVDPNDPSQTILDSGEPGTALFALADNQAEFPPGLVTYDGTTVTIDVSSLGDIDLAHLLFQLLNTDRDAQSKVRVSSVRSAGDPEGGARPAFSTRSEPVSAGGTLDLDVLQDTTDVEVLFEQVRFDSADGQYKAEIRVRNNGPAIGRTVVVRFPDLPNAVELLNASGVDTSGAPYVNMQPAIASGGLASGATSSAVLLEISDPSLLHFVLSATVLVGSPNRSPNFAPIGPLQVSPGGHLAVPLVAIDPDGDPVTYRLESTGALPQAVFDAAGAITFSPTPAEVGRYTFRVVATDGVANVQQTVQLDVVPDAIQTTRISGRVLATDGTPLEGVPVSLSRLLVLTDSEGRFTLELPGHLLPTEPFAIEIPTGDVFFDPFGTGTQTISFRRARFDTLSGTSIADPRRHPNLVSSFMDASIVYGSDDERAAALRTFSGGRLKVSSSLHGDLMPFNDTSFFPDGLLENDIGSIADPTEMFVAGDVRSSENSALAALHVLFLREHNRLAGEFTSQNPDWNDERIYQEARRWVIAELQHITYTEYLPLLLGGDGVGQYTGYDPNVDTATGAFFATAAFRIGHTQMVSQLLRLDANGDEIPAGHLTLREAFFNTAAIVDDGIDPILRGLVAQQAQEIDIRIIDELRSFLFGPPGSGGMDLPAMNIQRGRDLGLPGYAQARLDLGLTPVTSFAQITSDVALQEALEAFYGTVDKIDAFVGGIAEDHMSGAMVGELFHTAIARQFARTRSGDRFWYENGQFTASELDEIRGTTLSALIERNTEISGLPANVFTTAPTQRPTAGGMAASSTSTEFRTFTGEGNNVADPERGSTGQHLSIDTSLNYVDGISAPNGNDRPGPRESTNALMDQYGSFPNTSGATALTIFFGQLLSHDLDLTPTGTTDVLKFNADQLQIPGKLYPFVAEKIGLVLGHEVYEGVDNVIARPIYLPAIDVSSSTTTSDSEGNQTVTNAGLSASLFVAAGTLLDRAGNVFGGTLSITEVPRDLTPAALPLNLLPDLVVTIQPAEMVFTTPAPLTLPNLAGYEPGQIMDLWSINPITGFFDNVGAGQVSLDGTVINTVSGGIRNSSWHFFAPPPPAPNDPNQDPRNSEDMCNECKSSVKGTSEVESHSGAVVESHDLVTYQSLGTTRSLTLTYDSLRADPRPIIHFGYSNAQSGADQRLAAALDVTGPDGVRRSVAGDGVVAEQTGFHYWKIPAGGTVNIDAALQADLSSAPTGLYQYVITSGLVRLSNGDVFGSTTSQTGATLVVNSITSIFGAGWGVSGLEEIVENRDGSLLLINGDGGEMVFRAPTIPGQPYSSPPGEFSVLEKMPDGTFRRTMKDQTVYEFNSLRKLGAVRDRNGNRTSYEYDASGNLLRIIDPVGMVTEFNYSGGRVASITDPAGRVTQLEHDQAGNLIRITDPDGASRTWGYDNLHHMTREIDQRGFQESMSYDFAGRASTGTQKDGTTLRFAPVQVEGLFPPKQTSDPATAAVARSLGEAIATYADANGHVLRTVLDGAGQAVESSDGVGRLVTVRRNNRNLIESVTDGRGFVTQYTYDERGNVTSIVDDVVLPPAGQLITGAMFSVGDGPESVATGDINADGWLDIITANRFSNNISVLLSNGDATFQAQQILTVGSRPVAIKLSDVNADGRLDIVTANNGSDNVSILLGIGSSNFLAQQPVTVARDPLSLALGDVNGDGRLDIVTVSADSRNASVLLGNGDGSFQSKQDFSLDRSRPSAVALGDVNGDGRLDIVTANGANGNASVLLGNGNGQFASEQTFELMGSPSSVALGDLNRDGSLDIVTGRTDGNNISILFGDGIGGFQSVQSAPVGSTPFSVAIGDINGDGALDVVTANLSSNTVGILLGDGEGAFALSGSFGVGINPAAVALGDVDKDGRLDVITANAGVDAATGSVSVLTGNGDGSFQAPAAFSAGTDPMAIVLGDMDGDTVLDIVAANHSSGFIAILLGNGNGTYKSPQLFPVDATPFSLALGDVNGDGRLDVVTANFVRNNLSVLLGNGNGTVQAQQILAVGNLPESVALTDINGDGRLDIIAANYGSDIVSVLLRDGAGNYQPQTPILVGNGPATTSIGDVNGDGQLDIVVSNYDDGTISVLLRNGDGTFQSQPVVAAGSRPGALVLRDIDGDGRLDIVVANETSNTVSVLIGNGDGTFRARQPFAVGREPNALAVNDINNDGLLDIITANRLSNNLSVLLGNLDGGFATQQTFAAGSEPVSLAIGDVNGDGRLDVITSHREDNYVLVMLTSSSRDDDDPQPPAYLYDAVFSQLTGMTDELGREVLYEIDPANGDRLSMTQVMGERDSVGNGETDDLVTRYTYLANGLIDTVTDPLGHVTDYDYDALGRLIQVTFAVSTAVEAVKRYEYDPSTTAGRAGMVTAVIDENGNRTAYEYDVMNRLVRVIEPDPDGLGGPLSSPVSDFDYDATGRVTHTTDARGNTSQREYDAMGRLVRVSDSDPDGAGPRVAPIMRYTYDLAGNLVSTIDPLGNTTSYRYDARNRQIAMSDPDGGITQYRYDADNNLTALIDPVDNRTNFFYDARNRLLRETDPLGNSILYAYDPADNLIRKTDRNDRVTLYEYDDANRLTTETWVGEGAAPANVVLYAYDKADNLLSAVDRASAMVMTYDARNRIDTVDNLGSLLGGTPGAPRVLLDYAYDGVGNVISLVDSIDGSIGASTDYEFDALNRLVRLTQNGQGLSDKRVDFAYNPLGQFAEIRRFSDLAATQLVASSQYSYDALNRLTLLDHRNAASSQLAFYNFEYDDASRITAITDIDGRTAYRYDNRSQLTGADRSAADSRGDESYAYDANGNRTSSHLHGTGYDTGPGNRLLSDGTYDYEHDAEGNTVRRTEIATGSYRTFEWDHRNRLTAVKDFIADDTPTQVVEFTYDAFDRRITKAVDSAPADATDAALMHFVYDREDVLLDFVDPDGVSGVNAPLLDNRYIHGPGIDQVLAQDDGQGTAFWMLTDHLGTVRDLSGSNGAVINHTKYDSYGNIDDEILSSRSTRYAFTGREVDGEIDLQFNRTRYFDLTTGRFTARDTLGLIADSNPYGYVRNTPIGYIDPYGQEARSPSDNTRPASITVVGTFPHLGIIVDDGTSVSRFDKGPQSVLDAIAAVNPLLPVFGQVTQFTYDSVEKAIRNGEAIRRSYFVSRDQAIRARLAAEERVGQETYNLPLASCIDFVRDIERIARAPVPTPSPLAIQK